eukprot:g5637.t1 g5637   contig2:957270-959428(+)
MEHQSISHSAGDSNLSATEEDRDASLVGEEQQMMIHQANDDDEEDDDEGDELLSEPDYGYLSNEADDINNNSSNAEDDMSSSPNYDHLGLDCEEISASFNLKQQQQHHGHIPHDDEVATEQYDCLEEEYRMDNVGEEYILGTLMVRVLQARHLKSNPYNQGGGGGGITSLLSNHRRNRHQRTTMSPASGGNLTPSSSQQTIYGKLFFRGQHQTTSTTLDHSGSSGDVYWSRGDQSYFDVVCPSYPLRMGKKIRQQQQQQQQGSSRVPSVDSLKDVSCCKGTTTQQQQPQQHAKQCSYPPILQLALYSKKGGVGQHKQHKEKQMNPSTEDDYLLGKCSINVLRILTGKASYFDEWCTLHDDNLHNNNSGKDKRSNNGSEAGRVRIVIEYEPTDPPPRPGDTCVFANMYSPLVEELYPIPSHSIRNAPRSVRSSTSMSSFGASTSCTTLSSASTFSTGPNASASSLVCQPKQFRVEEVVGDHVVLSYQTPNEGWTITFEIHRYNLLCTHRHQAVVEKYKDLTLDLVDNISQSPMVEIIAKKVETLPEEGLVYVGAEAVGGGVALLGRWWETGVGGAMEDILDLTNLDGRYSHLSDDDEEEEDEEGDGNSGAQKGSSVALQSDAASFLQRVYKRRRKLCLECRAVP